MRPSLLLLLSICVFNGSVRADEIKQAIAVIAKAGPQAKNAQAARNAARKLARGGTAVLPQLFDALDTPNVVAANWYRSALDQIVDAELARPKPQLPVGFLKKYVKSKRQGRPRRYALNLLSKLQPQFVRSLIPTLVEDEEFRQDAIQARIKMGDELKAAGKKQQAVAVYKSAFKSARSSGQINTLAARLTSLGAKVSIIKHMGFVTRWHLLGPFDAPGTSGFATSFAPEQRVDLKAKYLGKNGQIGWKLYQTKNSMGQLNLIQAIAPVKEAVGYAYTEVDSPRSQKAQIRCGADDNLTIWLNGQKVLSRLQWLNGTRLDRFTASIQLRKGRNQLLVKVCQGPQHKNPAVPNNWSLQLRICDKTGAAVGTKVTLPAPKK